MTMLVCLQCSMRALLSGDPPPAFNETPEQHLRRMHPDPAATQVERRELEQQLSEQFKEHHDDH